jgi:hypothetical protein
MVKVKLLIAGLRVIVSAQFEDICAPVANPSQVIQAKDVDSCMFVTARL